MKAREKIRNAEQATTMGSANRKVFDGTYTANLSLIEFDSFGKHPIIRFAYTITDADTKLHEMAIGEMVEVRYTLDTEEGTGFAKKDFGRFGYDVNDLLGDIDSLEQTCDNVIAQKPVCTIAVVTSDGNTRMVRLENVT